MLRRELLAISCIILIVLLFSHFRLFEPFDSFTEMMVVFVDGFYMGYALIGFLVTHNHRFNYRFLGISPHGYNIIKVKNLWLQAKLPWSLILKKKIDLWLGSSPKMICCFVALISTLLYHILVSVLIGVDFSFFFNFTSFNNWMSHR